MENKRADKAFVKLLRAVGRTINKYEMIKDGDRIAVGVSGGEDSLVLLEILARRRTKVPINYELFAVAVDAEEIPYEINRQYLSDFCNKLDVPFYHKEIKLDVREGYDDSPCFICARKRRNRIFQFARELDCTSVALGHHGDDIIETLIMNMIFQGSISTMPPKLKIFEGTLEIIRPLAFILKSDISGYALTQNYHGLKSECPYEDSTKRNEIKRVVSQLETIKPDAKKNILKAMTNVMPEYLP